MLQRTLAAASARGQYVFPGGKVDDGDRADELEPCCDGLDDAAASRRLGLDHGGLAWIVAAIRECFEEAGVLLARPVGATEVVRFDTPEVAARFDAARHEIHQGRRTIVDLCAREGLVLLADRVHLVDHWVTPLGERRRFDTRFFVARAPDAQDGIHDDVETIASRWVRPDEALRLHRAGELQMFPPTVVSLGFLAPLATADAAVEAARTVGVPPVVVPRIVLDDAEQVIGVKVPGDDGYDDVADPEYVIAFPR